MTIDNTSDRPETHSKPSPLDVFRARWSEATSDRQSTSVNPYPGLRSFNVDEAHIFRARVNQIRALRNAFAGATPTYKARHVIMVVGGSSSGKSSIVKAGLLADIHSLQMPDEGGNWYVAECRPVLAPMQELLQGLATMLVDAVWNECKDKGSDFAAKVDEVLDKIDAPDGFDTHETAPQSIDDIRAHALRRVRALLDARLWSARHIGDPASMAPALTLFARETLNSFDRHLHRFRAGPPRLLISIDQFEEIFRNVDGPERDAIFDLIRFADQAEAQNAPELFVVVSMRSEELHRCSEFKGIADILNRSVHLVELVLRDDAKLAIVEPGRFTLQNYGFPFEKDQNWPFSADALKAIADAYEFASSTIEHRADALSLLQHFLRLLWDSAVGKWVAGTAGHTGFIIDTASLAAIWGWDTKNPEQSANGPGTAGTASEAQHRLASVLNHRANGVYERAIQAWCLKANDSSDTTKASARSVLKAAFVSLARRDDQRRVVRDWQTLSGMLAVSAEAERFLKINLANADAAARFAARFEAPLAAALSEFERATLIERRVDAAAHGRTGTDKYTVYHEAFIRNWNQYADWVREAGKAADTLRGIAEELSSFGEESATRDGRKREDIVTLGREADLSAVIGATDEDPAVPRLAVTEGSVPEHVVKGHSGWASRAWAESEIARSAKPGEPLHGATTFSDIYDARRVAIIDRANRLALAARAVEADRKLQAQKEKADQRAHNLVRGIAGAAVFFSAIVALTFHIGDQNTLNTARSRIAAFGLVGLEATETAATAAGRPIEKDRDVWLALHMLQPTGSIVDWPENKNIAHQRERMLRKIVHRARFAIDDAIYTPDKNEFFNNEFFGKETPVEKRAKCLRKQGTTISILLAKSADRSPGRIKYRIAGDETSGLGSLEYSIGLMPFRKTDSQDLINLDPATIICVAPDATALLVLTKRYERPLAYVVLARWNTTKLASGEKQWYLQNEKARFVRSFSSQVLLSDDPISNGRFYYFREGSMIGFTVPNVIGGPESSRAAPPATRRGVLWTNEGLSSPVIATKDISFSKSIAPVCISEKLGDRCELTVQRGASTITAAYFRSEGNSCVADLERCPVNLAVTLSEDEKELFSYEGRPPVDIEMENDFLWVRGDDDSVLGFNRTPETAKALLAPRWHNVPCGDKGRVSGIVNRSSSVIELSSLPNFYEQVPNFLDGRDCKPQEPPK